MIRSFLANCKVEVGSYLARGEPGNILALRFPEDLVNSLYVVHQFLGMFQGDLLFAGGTQLGRFPEKFVQVRIFFEMLAA